MLCHNSCVNNIVGVLQEICRRWIPIGPIGSINDVDDVCDVEEVGDNV